MLLQRQVLDCQDNRAKVPVVGEPGVAVLLSLLLHQGEGEGTWLLGEADHESQGLPQATLIEVPADVLAVVPRGMGGGREDILISTVHKFIIAIYCVVQLSAWY